MNIFSSLGEFLAPFASPEFYIELMCVTLSLSLAWLIALLVRRRVEHYLGDHPARRIEEGFILKPLSLFGPLLAIVYLGIFTPWVIQYSSGDLISAALKLSVAYLIARGVMLVVKSKPMGYFLASLIMLIAVLRVAKLLRPTVEYLKSLEFGIGSFHLSLLNLVHGIVILVIVLWLAGVMSRTLEDYLRRKSSLNYNTRELTVKFFKLFVYFLALMITLSAMGVDLTAFAVFGGALGVGIGLGLQKITSNFFSGITLLMEKSIKLGDLIEIDNVSGWVRQLNVRYTLLETFDGREMVIPNEELTTTRVINWTHSNERARVEINVGVAYGSDVKLVKQLLLEAAHEHPRCLPDPIPNCWLREFAESSLNFLLVFWVGDIKEGRYGPQSDVMVSILDKFKKNGIEIPYPQRVVHVQNAAPGN